MTLHQLFGVGFLICVGLGIGVALVTWLKMMREMYQERAWVWLVAANLIPIAGLTYIGWALTK